MVSSAIYLIEQNFNSMVTKCTKKCTLFFQVFRYLSVAYDYPGFSMHQKWPRAECDDLIAGCALVIMLWGEAVVLVGWH